MVFGAARYDRVTALVEHLGHRLGVFDDLRLVDLEFRLEGFLERDRFCRDHVHERAALRTRKYERVESFRQLIVLTRQDQATTWAPQGLVCCSRADVCVRNRARVQAGSDQARDVRHVDEQVGTDGVRDLAKTGPIRNLRIRREPCDDHLRLVLCCQRLDLVVIDQAGFVVKAIRNDVEQLAREIDGRAMREVATFIEAHAQNRVAWLNERMVNSRVGLRARVRLDVRVVSAKQLFRALYSQHLDIVDKFAATVVTLARVSLGVLVGELATLCGHDSRARVILRRDQLDMLLLALTFQVYGFGYFRIVGREGRRGIEHLAFAPAEGGFGKTGCYGVSHLISSLKVTDTVLRFDEGSHHAGPCTCQVVAIVAATAGTDDATLAVLVSQAAQRRRCMGMGLFSPAEMRDRITFKTVGTALHEDELGLPGINVYLDPIPGFVKLLVIRASCKRNIELRAFRPSLARLVRVAGTRVKHASVLVDVSKNQVRIVLKAIEHTITVVRVDIDIGDTLEAEGLAQVFDGNSAVVEHAETGSPVTCRMMQTRNRHERTLVVTMHDLVDGAEDGTNNSRCSIVNTFNSRCIALIEPAFSNGRHAGDLVDMLGCVKQRQFVYERRTWMPEVDDFGQAFLFQFRMKDIVAVNAKRMWIAETVGGNLFSFVNQHRLAHE